MFGYIIANRQELKLKDFDTYRSYYCGLCHQLHRQYGRTGQLLLNYDMTFLALLLTGLYEPEETESKRRCIPHPLLAHREKDNEAVRYCADMTVLLQYYKAADDWKDEKKPSARILLGALHKRKKDLEAMYPRQTGAMKKWIRELSRAEAAREKNPDIAAGACGQFLGEIYAWKEDFWRNDLFTLGFYLGKFIYLCDAWEDLDRDRKRGNYNVLLSWFETEPTPEQVKDLLVPMMSEAAAAFERLPILKGADILRNILYSGSWIRYAAVLQKREMKSFTNERTEHEKSI
ncbi:MAG: hypothetical protein IJI24_06295 [Lachnospiraceae bacterium]|nr:hypothetical protein [Lachnospiraceae bacterium]